ncbi:amidase [Povalibacter sp.]|uniref:amidase n=1 Tax=Povalibacter sp. TaxID=1962978 RepID=UPI002F40B42B
MNKPLMLFFVFVIGAWLSAGANAAEVSNKSIDELQAELTSGRTTSVALVRAYLQRIESVDRKGPTLQSVLSLNPDALREARALDAERKQKGARGPLHGIPLLIKDNIETADALPTTAGSLALIDNVTGRDAPIIANLRAAGAIVLGKTNLSEWANYRSDRSISGWSGVGGLVKNPHVLDRTACGSSSGSGSAAAAELAAATVGTETDGSIVCPASMNGVVGLKPTHGLLSGERIVPIAHSQDTAGPMTRSVPDAAALLTAMVGNQPACIADGCRVTDYVAALKQATLTGKRIGVWRSAPGRWSQIDPLYEAALDHLRAAGATLVEVPVPELEQIGLAERIVLRMEFKADLNAWLATTPPTVKTRTLEQLIEFNRSQPRETVIFGQEIFERSNASAGLDDPAYIAALTDSRRLARDAISRTLQENKLDLLVAPTTGPAWRIDLVNGDKSSGSFSTLPAVSGYPHLTVPMGTLQQLPLGLSFIGLPWSEAQLLAAAHVFEQRRGPRPAPKFLTSVDVEDSRRLPAPR